ncbi:MAG: hypothetical protein ACXV98_05780 [Ilumatobacteraceae bacterium]
MQTISLVDHTREHRPPGGVLKAIAEALTIQVERDFARAWNVPATRFQVGGRGHQIHIFDSAHQASDYGWHIVDGHGLPYAHAFAAPSITSGSTWTAGVDAVSATVSHEALEMLADPAANAFCFDGRDRLWSREVCDPVQENTYGIVAGGIKVSVSDFVLPAFFNPWAPGPYDHLRVLDEPFSLAKGGYAVVERATADHERHGRRHRQFDATFDESVPEWRRRQKIEGWGRTYWRLKLHP